MCAQSSEKDSLLAAFEEGAAVGGWLLIELISRNPVFFCDNPEFLNEAERYLRQGLDCGETKNFRMAKNHYVFFLNKVRKKFPELISGDRELIDALVRIDKIDKEKIEPLWKKYADEF